MHPRIYIPTYNVAQSVMTYYEALVSSICLSFMACNLSLFLTAHEMSRILTLLQKKIMILLCGTAVGAIVIWWAGGYLQMW